MDLNNLKKGTPIITNIKFNRFYKANSKEWNSPSEILEEGMKGFILSKDDAEGHHGCYLIYFPSMLNAGVVSFHYCNFTIMKNKAA